MAWLMPIVFLKMASVLFEFGKKYSKTIIAHVPITNGQVQETGDFELDGVTFPAAEVQIEFLDPADDGEEGGDMFPTGNVVDQLDVPEIGSFQATFINAGIPTIFLNAEDLGYEGTELQDHINGDAAALARFEKFVPMVQFRWA